MHRALLLAILFLLFFGEAQLLAGSEGARPVHALGQAYLALKDWAEQWQFDLKWIKRDDELRATNKGATVTFKVNSQRAEINGVNAFLSFPIILQNGAPLIASQDVDHLLAPILRPPRNKSSDRIKTVALCPGHGGRDPGFQIGAEQE